MILQAQDYQIYKSVPSFHLATLRNVTFISGTELSYLLNHMRGARWNGSEGRHGERLQLFLGALACPVVGVGTPWQKPLPGQGF